MACEVVSNTGATGRAFVASLSVLVHRLDRQGDGVFKLPTAFSARAYAIRVRTLRDAVVPHPAYQRRTEPRLGNPPGFFAVVAPVQSRDRVHTTALVASRLARLSYFFPAHNEEANLEGLVAEALETLPHLADTFEIIAVDDGSRDGTPALADALAAAHPDVVRVVHHPTNLGYGAALRSGFGAARYEHVAFTDGDRQFKVADIGRLTERMAESDRPDVVVGFRIKRADPPLRIAYARAYRLANRIFFGLTITDVDCACKLFRREALEGLRVESGGAFFSAEMIIKLRAAGRTVVEVGVPHYPRTAGSASGAKPQVVLQRGPRLLAPPPADVGQPSRARCVAASRWS